MLFRRGKKGQVITWQVEIDGPKYRMITGAKDKKLVTSTWTICEEKNVGRANETTAEQQAISEATSKWAAKKDKEHYFEDESDIDISNFVKCMLAQKYEDRKDKIDFSRGLIVQIKFNGFRCTATRNGLFTRKGEKYVSIPHIEKSLKKFFVDHPDAVLDGELFNYDLRQKLNEISKLCRKSVNITDEDLEKSEKFVRYCVYDGWGFFGLKPSDPYSTRKEWINKNLKGYCNYYSPVKDWWIYSIKELEDLYVSFLDDDQEGAIIRIPDSPYQGNRSKYLLKYKPQDDDEAFIVDIMEGNGNWSGAAKTATLSWNNKTFDATFKGKYEDLVKILKNKKDWINKEVTFKYFGFTGLGTPQSARIDPYNCFPEK